MHLDALKTIGEAVIEEFESEYEVFYTPEELDGTASVVAVQFSGWGETISYDGAMPQDVTDVATMARKYGYQNNYNQIDYSLTKQASSSLSQSVDQLFKWPHKSHVQEFVDDVLNGASGRSEEASDEGELPSEMSSPTDSSMGYIQTVTSALSEYEDTIRADLESLEDSLEYPIILAVGIAPTDEDTYRYPGSITEHGELARYTRYGSFESISNASRCVGEGTCSVCGTTGTVYGTYAKSGVYLMKNQAQFTEYNASNAWRDRPLCGDCINSIDVATGSFLKGQSYGTFTSECWVIPYALPVPEADERLKELIRNASDTLLGGATVNPETEREMARPIASAWDFHRKRVDLDSDQDKLRLAFLHWWQDENSPEIAHQVSWIDGVPVDHLVTLEATMERLLDTLPPFAERLLPTQWTDDDDTEHTIVPTERQIFTGMWFYTLFGRESDSDHEGQRIGDDVSWVALTDALLTRKPISKQTVIGHLVEELLTRYRAAITRGIDDDTAYTSWFDHFLLAKGLLALAAIDAVGSLTDTQVATSTEDNVTHMFNTDTELNEEYDSFAAAITDYLTIHVSVGDSPGRTAAFAIGAMAKQLDLWQQRRDLSRTFLQNRDAEHLTSDTLDEWQRQIKRKSEDYNAQAGNYGTPWNGVHKIAFEAVTAGREHGWSATTDEIRYYFMMGSTIGPFLKQRVVDDGDDEDPDGASTETTTD